MKKHILLPLLMILSCAVASMAQRSTDVLDRGLVAVKTSDGVFCSWRIPAEEWYDVAYNIYRDGNKLNDTPLQASNFLDAGGTMASTYTVAAVVRGVEMQKSDIVTPLEKNYMLIHPKHDPSLTSTYVPNDACCADVDGDGVVEILLKYDNESEISASYPKGGHNGEYSLFECLKLDGTVLWWVNCGPNMGDFQNNEQNIVGYDWDGDGRAEVVFRAADGTTIHMADGEVYTVGDASINYRAATGGGTNWFMHSGKEYLLYVDGLTGRPYQCIDYPLPRLEDDENPSGLLSGSAYDNLVNKAWGDGYGHRSTKHFFGAPYLDGRRPSIFIARGIYTRHKMVTYDVDPATHTLVERWRWNCSEAGSWFGQGYHNYSIADVDWDGRDEIVFGSMVIDDNGKGLSTTGLGHGDSHHVGDFDPYTHGQEIFACNEDQPNNNFRDATTSKIYYRTTGGNDDGRANMGNFIDEYPGAQGLSSRDPNLVGGASHKAIVGDSKSSVSITQNFRIYWDGDLCDESFDYSNGKNTQGAIFKAREGRIALLEGSKTNNDTKGTPCYQGDIFGDWREEVIMRDANNDIRIYTTDIPTPWRLYSLWHDPQYRNAMVWQMCGYNQTPHTSFFVGAFEGITTPPAPNTMTGRTEVANGTTITHDLDGKHIIMCANADMSVDAVDGAAPYILTVNAPTWVQGNDGSKIITDTYTHTIASGSFAGDMRLIKQGDGTLVLPAGEHTYSGATEVWAGTLCIDGALTASPVWLNRFATLSTSDGSFPAGITLSYASSLNIGSDTAPGKLSTSTLTLGFGSVLPIDLFADGASADFIKAQTLVIEKKDWANGPQYLAPVIRLIPHTADAALLDDGRYLVGEVAEIQGDLSEIIIKGIDNQKKVLVYEDGKLYVDVMKFENSAKTWSGSVNSLWNIDNALNFVDDASAEFSAFYPGDIITFDDSAVNTDIEITENVMPASLTFANNEKEYTISGEGSIVGETSLLLTGDGTVTINNVNTYSGGTYIEAGKLVANSFANRIGTQYGSLGAISNPVYLSNNAVLSANASVTVGNRINIRQSHATIDTPNGITITLENGITESVPGQILYKSGSGTLNLATGNSFSRLVIQGGTVNDAEDGSSRIALPPTVEFVKGSLYDVFNISSYSTNSTKFVVSEGNSGSLYLDARCNYTGTLTGAGSFTVYATSVRNYLQGDWSAFQGTLTANSVKRGSYDPIFLWSNNFGLPNATLSISANTTFDAETRSVVLGNLTGSGTINTSGTITVGGLDKAFSFNGSFSGSPTLVKVGKGEWKISKQFTGIRSVTVKDGAVSLAANNLDANVLPIPLTISNDALLRGRGTINSIIAKAGATLQPGYYRSTSSVRYGAITTTGDVTIEPDAILSLYIRKANAANSHSFLTVGGNLAINGNVEVEIDPEYVPAIGDEFSLWTAQSFTGTISNLKLPELPAGLAWDISELATAAGILRVTDAAGIDSIAADAEVTCTVYTPDGVVIGKVSTTRADAVAAVRRELRPTAGIYILRIASSDASATVKVQF